MVRIFLDRVLRATPRLHKLSKNDPLTSKGTPPPSAPPGCPRWIRYILLLRTYAHLGQIIDFPLDELDLSRQIDCQILYDLVHVAGWEPCILHDLAHVSWVGSVLYRSCTTLTTGRWGTRWSRSWSVRVVCIYIYTCKRCYIRQSVYCWEADKQIKVTFKTYQVKITGGPQ